jgi:hypothetical protein
MRALKAREKRILTYLAILIAVLVWDSIRRHWVPKVVMETDHYTIYSSATMTQTREIGQVAEIVYGGYRQLLDELHQEIHPHPRLKSKLIQQVTPRIILRPEVSENSPDITENATARRVCYECFFVITSSGYVPR